MRARLWSLAIFFYYRVHYSSVARACASGLYRRFCALRRLSTFRAQAPGSACTGITTEANSPFGAYAAEGVTVTFFTPITNLNAVPFTLELSVVDGGQPRDFDGGAFEGSARREFSLQGTYPPAGAFALNNLDIQWCPDQNYFQVTVDGKGPHTLRSPPPPPVSCARTKRASTATGCVQRSCKRANARRRRLPRTVLQPCLQRATFATSSLTTTCSCRAEQPQGIHKIEATRACARASRGCQSRLSKERN